MRTSPRALRLAMLALLAAIPSAVTARANVIQVLPTDSAAVNIARIEAAGPGDEVVVAPGTYRFRLYLQGQGTPAEPIVIHALDPAERPVWDLVGDVVASWPGSYSGGDAGRSIWQITGSNYQISGIVFRNGSDGGTGDSGGLRFKSSGPVTLRQCLFQFNDNGIQGASSDLLVESCEFDRNGLPRSSDASHNIYIHGGTITVRHSYIHDAQRAQNLHIRANAAVFEYNWIARAMSYMGDMMPCTMEPCSSEQTMLLRGNVFIQGTPENDGQIFVMYNDQNTPAKTFRLTMVNNTIVGSGDPSALVHFANLDPANNAMQTAVLDNNVIYHVAAIQRVDDSGLSNWQLAGTHNWIGTGTADLGTLTGTVPGVDPVFRSTSGRDFAPAAGSPLVGAADDQLADLPTEEYFRDEAISMQSLPRASVDDIGAFESTTMRPTVASLCAPTPATGCRSAAARASSVQISDDSDDARDRLRWKWARGAATDPSAFKDPGSGSATYRLCVYDSSGIEQPLAQMDVPPGGPCGGRSRQCWSASGSAGFRYRNTGGTPNGLTAVRLVAGATGRARVQANGGGANLPTPTLPLTLPVTVQLVAADGSGTECWQTVYSTSTINDAARFSAKGP